MSNPQIRITKLTAPQISAFKELFPGISGAQTQAGRPLTVTTASTVTIEQHPGIPAFAAITPAKLAEAGRVIAARRGLKGKSLENLLEKLASSR